MVRNEPLEAAVIEILAQLGYAVDGDSQHFLRTPQRVAESLSRFQRVSDAGVSDILDVTFTDAYSSLVQVGPVRYVSMCAHHLLPVEGVAYVGYLPDANICGLSKLVKLVDHYAHQLTVQERVTDQISDALEMYLKPKGCMVVIRAQHGCMSIRGVSDPGALTTTSAVRGLHQTSASTRAEFLTLVSLGS